MCSLRALNASRLSAYSQLSISINTTIQTMEKSYFEQQREVLIGDIAAVSISSQYTMVDQY